MSFVKYVLLAILGSTPIAPANSGNLSPRTYDAESVSQPRGGAPSEAGSSNSNKNTSANKNVKKPAQKSGKKSSGGTTTPSPK